MATTTEEDVQQDKPEGIIAKVGNTTYRVAAETITPDPHRRPIWPMALILVCGAASAAALGAAPVLGALGILSASLLAFWVGARG